MADLPFAWAAYTHFQSRLSSLFTLDDGAWGFEGALNIILEPDFSPELTTDEEFRRAAASASRKRRDHLARFLAELNAELDPPDAKDMLEQLGAREALHAIEKGLDQPQDLRLLSGIAHGHGYDDLSVLLGQPASSLRSRTSRLRRKFAHLKP